MVTDPSLSLLGAGIEARVGDAWRW